MVSVPVEMGLTCSCGLPFGHAFLGAMSPLISPSALARSKGDLFPSRHSTSLLPKVLDLVEGRTQEPSNTLRKYLGGRHCGRKLCAEVNKIGLFRYQAKLETKRGCHHGFIALGPKGPEWLLETKCKTRHGTRGCTLRMHTQSDTHTYASFICHTSMMQAWARDLSSTRGSVANLGPTRLTHWRKNQVGYEVSLHGSSRWGQVGSPHRNPS